MVGPPGLGLGEGVGVLVPGPLALKASAVVRSGLGLGCMVIMPNLLFDVWLPSAISERERC